MRNNQPVNQKEYRMQQGDILVSKTDLKGRLTYVNEAFCKIAGMTEEELIGKPHNVVRHPDMPSSAFADLWETVQAGKPWTGFVKNRSADGGFYWVKANVAPDYNEKGNIIGYISVRTYPTRDEINTYSSLYKNVNAGKETLSSSLRFPFLRSIKVKTKMLLVSVLSTLTMLGLLWLVYADMSKAITKGEMQLKGLAYAVGVRQVMEHLPQHRGMANEYLNGNTNLKDRIKMEVQQVDQALEVLVAAEKQYADDLGASGMVADIVKKWSKISTRWKYLSSEESFAKHTSLTNDLLDLSIHTGGTSGFLSSDSMIASMSARVLSVESVRLIEYLGKLRGLGAAVAAKGDVSNTEKAALIKADVSSDIMLEQVVASLSEAVMASKVEGMEINKVDFVQVLENMRRSGQIFSTMAKQTLINSDQINISSKVYFNTGSKAIASTLEMFDEVAKETKEHLKLSLRHNTNTLHMILWVSTLSVLFTIILLFMVVRATLAPLAVVNHVLKSIVSNNYSTDCTKNQNDEMGDVLDLIKVTQSRLQFEIFESRHASMKQKEIDGKRRKDEQLEDLALAETFESDVGSLVTTLSGNASAVHKSMKNLSAIADALNDQAQDAITGVSSSSDYVGTTAAAIEEMSISVASVVDQINETLNVSEQAVKEANDTAKIMQELVTASEEIGSVVATISDIAEQTNLLALNASIEAARAGDARRGFAVVAGEVKELANQTSKATGQIRNKVEHIQMQSREAGQAIGEIHGIIEKVNAYSSHVAAAMVQQSEATREMSSGAQQASASMHDVQVSVGEVTSAATEVDDSAEANLALVEEMLEQMNAVQVQVEAFVARLKG